MNRILNATMLLVLAASLSLSACNKAQSNENDATDTGTAAQERKVVEKPAPVCNTCGVVKAIKRINARPEGSGLGAAMGAVVGGLAGSQIGGGTGKSIATVAGVVGGAVAGNNIERNRNAEHYYEVVVALDNGDYRTMHVPDASGLSVGSAVTVDVDTIHLR